MSIVKCTLYALNQIYLTNLLAFKFGMKIYLRRFSPNAIFIFSFELVMKTSAW